MSPQQNATLEGLPVWGADDETVGDSFLWMVWGPHQAPSITVVYGRYVGPSAPQVTRIDGTLWRYQRRIGVIQPSGLYIEARALILSRPHVLVVCLLLAAYPSLAFYRGPLRRWRRHRKGSCLNCGYNLTANESGTCPECGEKVE